MATGGGIYEGMYIHYPERKWLFRITKEEASGDYANVHGVLYMDEDKKRVEYTRNKVDIKKDIASGDAEIVDAKKGTQLSIEYSKSGSMATGGKADNGDLFKRVGDRPFPYEIGMYDYNSQSHYSSDYPYRLTDKQEEMMMKELGINTSSSRTKYVLSQYELMMKYAKHKGWKTYSEIGSMATGGITMDRLNTLIAEINQSGGGKFYLEGSYGQQDLWATDKDGGSHRIESGSKKDIYESLVKNRYNKKYNPNYSDDKKEKGGSINKMKREPKYKYRDILYYGGKQVQIISEPRWDKEYEMWEYRYRDTADNAVGASWISEYSFKPNLEAGGEVEDKHDYDRRISLYESFIDPNLKGMDREVIGILAQGVYSDARKEKMLKRAKLATEKAISEGRYDYKQEVYVHPTKAQKPYLEKYRVTEMETGGSLGESKQVYWTLPKTTPVHNIPDTKIIIESQKYIYKPALSMTDKDLEALREPPKFKIYMESPDGNKYWMQTGLYYKEAKKRAEELKYTIQSGYKIADLIKEQYTKK